MANRQRNHTVHLSLSNEELAILEKKIKISGLLSKQNYLLKLVMSGKVYRVNFDFMKDYISLLGKIYSNLVRVGGNINQVIKKINLIDEVSREDWLELKNEVDQLKAEQKKISNELLHQLQVMRKKF